MAISQIASQLLALGMSSPARNEMDVDAFLAWAEGRQGRWETRVLREGKVILDPPGFDALVAVFFAID
jgi:hypothetical protein